MAPTSHDGRALLAINVKRLRAARGWSQEDLEGYSGISRPYLSDIENEKRNIAIDNITALATAFEVELSELFSLTPPDLTPRPQSDED